MNNNSPARRLLGLSFVLSLAIAGVLAVTRYQDILDWWALRGYNPPARIAALASETTMVDSTRRVFYASHPELDDKATFKGRCQIAEQSIVLGCYITHRGIFLLDVTEPRLSGVIQVTAAHETLHAHYDRLSSSERKRVDGLTAGFFSQLQDERIKKTVEQYRSKDPTIVPNELHSILATEVRQLSPELEKYYSRYFADRQKIVAFSEQYEQTFLDLKNQVANYDIQLSRLKTQIEANETQITALGNRVETQRGRLDQMLANKQIEEYNAAVPGFNALVNQYNSLIGQAKRQIAEYNAIVEKRNAAATTEQELVKAIDSNSIPDEQKQ